MFSHKADGVDCGTHFGFIVTGVDLGLVVMSNELHTGTKNRKLLSFTLHYYQEIHLTLIKLQSYVQA